MESEVMKENNDPHQLQKPPKPEQKEKGPSPNSSEEIKIQSPHHDSSAKPQSPNMDSYDPNRIPSSVFSTKTGGTSSQAEWSASSNESLFSIQMGNNSFSNDYAIMYGKSEDFDLNNPQLKSGELPRLDEWSNNTRHNAPAKSSELSSLPPVMEHEEGSLQSGESSRVKKRDGSPLTIQSHHDTFRTPASPQANSRISSDSNKSFAFPV